MAEVVHGGLPGREGQRRHAVAHQTSIDPAVALQEPLDVLPQIVDILGGQGGHCQAPGVFDPPEKFVQPVALPAELRSACTAAEALPASAYVCPIADQFRASGQGATRRPGETRGKSHAQVNGTGGDFK
jgi:hypothetical protein